MNLETLGECDGLLEAVWDAVRVAGVGPPHPDPLPPRAAGGGERVSAGGEGGSDAGAPGPAPNQTTTEGIRCRSTWTGPKPNPDRRQEPHATPPTRRCRPREDPRKPGSPKEVLPLPPRGRRGRRASVGGRWRIRCRWCEDLDLPRGAPDPAPNQTPTEGPSRTPRRRPRRRPSQTRGSPKEVLPLPPCAAGGGRGRIPCRSTWTRPQTNPRPKARAAHHAANDAADAAADLTAQVRAAPTPRLGPPSENEPTPTAPERDRGRQTTRASAGSFTPSASSRAPSPSRRTGDTARGRASGTPP
jgi:hypothetical protein